MFFFSKCNAFKFTVFNIETKSKQFMYVEQFCNSISLLVSAHTHTHTLRVSLPKANQVWTKRGPISFINQFFSVRLMAKTVCKWPLINYIKQSYFNLLPSFRRCERLRTAGTTHRLRPVVIWLKRIYVMCTLFFYLKFCKQFNGKIPWWR